MTPTPTTGEQSETLSVARALLRLSDSVAALSRDVQRVYLPIALAILVVVVVQIILH
jgi:hypothetical protein